MFRGGNLAAIVEGKKKPLRMILAYHIPDNTVLYSPAPPASNRPFPEDKNVAPGNLAYCKRTPPRQASYNSMPFSFNDPG